MKRLNLTRLTGFIIMLLVGGFSLIAQDITTIEATNADISDHLNLEAVASVFGDAKDLEDFEKKLNDPELRLSNLDLNNDGYVDYLRVVEYTENYTHLIVIQAVLDKDVYQDVATIEVERDDDGKTRVQVVGDVYMYGEDYIIEPVYIRTPVFFVHFWRPYYRPYYSVYYWDYWPHYWHVWRPVHIDVYYHHVYNSCINYHYHYNYTHVHHSHIAAHLHRRYRRNDYGRRYPKRSFVSRRGTKRMNLDKVRRSSESRRSMAIKTKKIKPASPRNANMRSKPTYKTGKTLRNSSAKKDIRQGNKPIKTKPVYRTGKEIRNGKPMHKEGKTKPVYRNGKTGHNNTLNRNGMTKPVYRSSKSDRSNSIYKGRNTKPIYRNDKSNGKLNRSGKGKPVYRKDNPRPVYRSGKPKPAAKPHKPVMRDASYKGNRSTKPVQPAARSNRNKPSSGRPAISRPSSKPQSRKSTSMRSHRSKPSPAVKGRTSQNKAYSKPKNGRRR